MVTAMRLRLVLLAGCLGAVQAHAQVFVEVDHVDLAVLDPATNDGRLGRTIALANGGNTLLVAAPFKEDLGDSGSQDGSVYSFTVLADGTLQFEQELAPATRYQFGKTLAADGEWAVAGESSARVHVMRLSGATWSESQLITLDDVVEPAGVDIRGLTSYAAMQGDLLALGNHTANVTVSGNTTSNAGAVVLFRRGSNGQWVFEDVLVPPTLSGTSEFGTTISVSGDTVVVGAPSDRVAGAFVGGAYVFQRSGGVWNYAATLRNPEEENARFAWSVAVDGNFAIVGCATCLVLPNPEDPSNTGSFFAFERNLGGTGNWGLRGEFFGSNPGFIDNFSKSLRLRGPTLMVGASGTQEASFFLRDTSGDWNEVARLPSGDTTNTVYGISVDFVGGRAQIGADAWPDDGSATAPRRGAVSAWYGAVIETCGSFEGIFCDGFDSVD